MSGSPRGRLHIYLGAAPGVGKTTEMLERAHRLVAEGKDVVVGLVRPTAGRGPPHCLPDWNRCPAGR